MEETEQSVVIPMSLVITKLIFTVYVYKEELQLNSVRVNGTKEKGWPILLVILYGGNNFQGSNLDMGEGATNQRHHDVQNCP